jgi:hypothetical protein
MTVWMNVVGHWRLSRSARWLGTSVVAGASVCVGSLLVAAAALAAHGSAAFPATEHSAGLPSAGTSIRS